MNNFKNCHETILTVTSERFMNVKLHEVFMKLHEDYTKISLQSTKFTGLRTSGLNTGGPAKCNYVTLIGG